jgi:plasmid stabilization system protein ParE
MVRRSPEAVGRRVTRRVVFRPEAEDEVLETRRWYEERREELGAEFGRAVDAMVERIVTSPLAFPCAHGETRRGVLPRFPYAIYFRVLADGAIVVLAVHGRQHPSHWQTRS